MRQNSGPLAGVRIVECSMLGPGAITTHLADLGADVIKVEPPTGDYIREMTWPWVEGVSLMHLHISRGKRSVVLDLRTDEGKATFLELVATADAVVEALGKMTILPARRMQTAAPVMARKGRLQRGADADIVVFDPATVADTSTVAEPARKAVGIEWVLVDGLVVQAPGGEQRTDVRPGRPITPAA